MTDKEKQLWNKIKLFQFDDDKIDFNFSNRLARENNWSLSYSKEVIEEYKKFIFLSCITKIGVTPSDQVDQVWHLHLTYTKSYWIDFCKNTLEKEIHHNPTKGGASEAQKFDDYYSKTKAEYKKLFQSEPPIAIWPDNKNRFSEINFKRINVDKNWILQKPNFNWKSTAFKITLLLTSLLFIQAKSDNDFPFVIVFIAIIIGLGIYNASKNNNGNGGSSGCSTGCSFGDSGSSGHHGCSGHGCSSGCSGCGGGD
jgi:hypothetical protein